MNYVLKRLLLTPIGFSAQIQAAFPGSEWATADGSSREQLGPDSLHPGLLRPSPASTVSALGGSVGPCPADPLPQGSARAVEIAIQPQSLAVIGGAKFNEAELEKWISSLPQDILIVTGDGRGAEKAVRSLCEAHGLRVDVPALHPEWYGPKALEIQVSAILSMTMFCLAPIVLIGKGVRVNTAKSWFKRANWDRELTQVASEP